MSPQKEKFLAVATVTSQLKMHFPKAVAAELRIGEGGVIGFYQMADGEVVLRRM